MLPEALDRIAENDISSLVTNQIGERKRLEYKEQLPEGTDKAKKEFLADVCSLANAEGGDIVFGIRDLRDANGRPTGIAESVTGVAVPNTAAACERLEQMIRDGIGPRIPKTETVTVEMIDGKRVIVLRIHKSWIKPHMVTFGGSSRFYSRNSTGKFQLDVNEIGQAFAEQQSFTDRLHAWRLDRIGKTLSDDTPVALDGPAKLLFHFIPAQSLVGQQPNFNWRMSESLQDHVQPSSLSSSVASRYNADGFLKYSLKGFPLCSSYVQVFRNGCLEYGDGYILNAYRDDGPEKQNQIPSKDFEKKLCQTYENAVLTLNAMVDDGPIYISCTLLSVKGLRLSRANSIDLYYPTFDREVISTSEFQIPDRLEGRPYAGAMLPLINSIWQSNGYVESPHATQNWNPFAY
jgi:hypothetical protein